MLVSLNTLYSLRDFTFLTKLNNTLYSSRMANHTCEETLSKQNNAFVSLNEEIESQKQKIIDVEQKNIEKAACMRKLNESFNMVMEMMKKENQLNEQCTKELQKMKVLNSNMSHNMECVKKEHRLITKELEGADALREAWHKHLIKVRSENDELRSDLKQQKDNNNNASKLAEELKLQNEQLNVKVVQLENQLKGILKLESENQQLKGKAIKIQEQLKVRNEQHNAIVVQLRDQLKCSQKLESENKQLEWEATKLQEELKVQNEQHNAKLVQLENKLKCNEKLKLKNQQLKGKAMKLQEELKVQNDNHNAKVVQLENQLKCNQKLEIENQQLKGKLDVMKYTEDEFLKTVGTLHMKVIEKEESLKDSEDFNQSLIVKERESNDELQKARKKMINGIVEIPSGRSNIVAKRMGELDSKPFLKSKALSATRGVCNKEAAEQRALEMCSLWQKELEDPHWYPFKIITIGRISKEVINNEDEKLKELKKKCGVEAYNAVVTALREINEYNPSGRFAITEMWNKREKRRATLEEGIEFLFNRSKTKRRKICETGRSESGDLCK